MICCKVDEHFIVGYKNPKSIDEIESSPVVKKPDQIKTVMMN